MTQFKYLILNNYVFPQNIFTTMLQFVANFIFLRRFVAQWKYKIYT